MHNAPHVVSHSVLKTYRFGQPSDIDGEWTYQGRFDSNDHWSYTTSWRVTCPVTKTIHTEQATYSNYKSVMDMTRDMCAALRANGYEVKDAK